MAVAELPRIETVTGITPADLRDLNRVEKLTVATWQTQVAGFDDGAEFYGRRIRDLPIAGRLALAQDPEARIAWEQRELRRIAVDPAYFIAQYGSVQPEEGPPIPFDLWPEQVETTDKFLDHNRVIVLKARQLGLTWIALHLAVWYMAFNPATPKAKILALSKIGSDADDLVERARKLMSRLPRFMRPAEKRRFADSNSRLVLTTGAEMRALMGTVAAARSFTATIALLDEFAFYRNGQAAGVWTAVNSTLGEAGKAWVISTGNGEAGDGGAFADLWRKDTLFEKVFLPDTVNPARQAPGWREKKQREFLTDEDFRQEHPLTEDDAFIGAGSFKVYPQAGIAGALRIGEALDPHLPDLIEQGVEWGIDWGDFQTFVVYALPLPNGGAWIFDEQVIAHTEPGKASEQIIYHDPAGVPGARFVRSVADSLPKGNNRTFGRILREAYNAQPDRYPRKHMTVDFSRYKQDGGQRQVTAKPGAGANTVGYIRALLDAAEVFRGDPLEAAGLLAISPRCHIYAAQMRNLEREADTGKVVKPALDPRHIQRGDHGPDASIALLSARAKSWRLEVGA